MKAIIWTLFILMLSIWTGMTLLTAYFVNWMVQGFGSTQSAELGALLNNMPLPPQLSPWIDPALLQSIQSSLAGLIEGISQAIPNFASVIAWLSPLMWGVWGLGALALFLFAITGHWLVGSFSKTPQH
jgi:hypothetical protein